MFLSKLSAERKLSIDAVMDGNSLGNFRRKQFQLMGKVKTNRTLPYFLIIYTKQQSEAVQSLCFLRS